MDNQDVTNLINQLSIPNPDKERLLLRLKEKGINEDLVSEIRAVLLDVENNLEKRMKPEIEELENILSSTIQDLDKAQKNFDEEIKDIEKEADEVYKTASEEIDKVNLEEARNTVPE